MMTKSEYQELVEFIAARFTEMNQRFDGVDRRFEALERRVTRVEVLLEQQGDRIRILAEAVTSLDGKLEAFRDATEARLARLEAFRSN
jgi:predicted  nucleic acid-binding Zn-ribbon protein